MCTLSAIAEVTGRVASDELTEISGLAVSCADSNVLWVHNDSGDSARFFALDPAGRTLAVFSLAQTYAFDWEDMAAGPGPVPGQTYLYIGDIGDNKALRPNITVYRIPEPSLPPEPNAFTLTQFEALWFLYPDGPRDAETLMTDPATKDLYIVSKEYMHCHVYVSRYPQHTDRFNILELIATVPIERVTAGDIAPDGRRLLLRNQNTAVLWEKRENEDWKNALARRPRRLPLALEPAGETIAFAPSGDAVFAISEGLHPLIYRYDNLPTAGPQNAAGPQENSNPPR